MILIARELSAAAVPEDETAPTRDSILAKATDAAFGRPLIVNNLRALVVEALLSTVLSSEWRWCAADWAGWDFEHVDGTRLEVKQSAAKQTWPSLRKRALAPRFDVAERTGFWEGANWVSAPGRLAHLYVFAYHPVADETADHRDPDQWIFYVMPAHELPNAKSISLSRIKQLAISIRCSQLASFVDHARVALKGTR